MQQNKTELVTGAKMERNMTNNEELHSIIEDKQLTIYLLVNSEDIEDYQLERINEYLKLPPLYQDLIYMEKVLSLTHKQIADIYKVSKSMIEKMLKKIKMEFYI